MRAINTISFWACVVMAFINLVIFFVAQHLHSGPLAMLSLLTMSLLLVAAYAHYALGKRYGKKP